MSDLGWPVIDWPEWDDPTPDLPPRRYRCRDRMCGADDCPTCHPTTWDAADREPTDEATDAC